MSVTVVPYSVREFNQIPSLEHSDKELHQKQGEDFILNTVRQIILNHDLSKIFGVQSLHSHFYLNEGEKLVELNNQATPWKLEEGDRLLGGQVKPTSFQILKGQGLMPYEFEFVPMSEDKGIDLTEDKYQSFLKDFVSAVESAGLDSCLALSIRPDQPSGMEITQGRTNIFLPTGTFKCDPKNAVTAGWFFNTKVTGPAALNVKEGDIDVIKRMCDCHEGDRDVITRLCNHTDHEAADAKDDNYYRPHGGKISENAGVLTRACSRTYEGTHKKKAVTSDVHEPLCSAHKNEVQDGEVVTRQCWPGGDH